MNSGARLGFFALFISALSGSTMGQSREAPQINMEYGGDFSLTYSGQKQGYTLLLSTEPFFVKYFSSLFIGPIIGVQVERSEYTFGTGYGDYTVTSHSSEYILGARVGTLLGEQNTDLIPYASGGITLLIFGEGGSTGMAVPLEGGLKFRISRSGFVNLGAGYTFASMNSVTSHTLGFRIGVSLCN